MNEEFPLVVFTEATNGLGEDGKPVVVKEQETVVIGVFDGLGGRSAGYEGKTGGRIASGWASHLAQKFLEQKHGNLSKQDAIQLQQEICRTLKVEADNKIKLSRLKGTLVNERLCTTLALVSISQLKPEDNSFHLSLAWIGDSRIYFLSPSKGLQQLTKDDLTEQNDAFELIRKDPPMSQYITADLHLHSDWQINFKKEVFTEQGCVLACTDGCFQYLESPWNFEKLILNTLVQSESVGDWKTLLEAEYEKIKQDDISFVLQPVAFNNFSSLKDLYQERLHKILHDFRSESSSYNELIKLWDIYRPDYEERLASSYQEIIVDSSDEEVDSSLPLQHDESLDVSSQNIRVDDVEKEDYQHSSLAANKPDEITNTSKTLEEEKLKLIQDGEFSDQINRLLKKAEEHVDIKYWQGVINVYTKILDFDPENLYPQSEIALAYFELARYEQRCYGYGTYVSRYYQTVYEWLTRLVNDANTKNILIPTDIKEIFAFVLQRIGKDDEAIQVCKDIIKIDKNAAFAFELVGTINRSKGLYEQALKYTKKAISLYTNDQNNPERISSLEKVCDELQRELAKIPKQN